MKKDKLTPKQSKFLEVFKTNTNNISVACAKAGISRVTFYEWINKSNEFAQKVDEAKEALIDFAESQLFENIKEGKETSLIFFLKTQAKSRGYIEKSQVEHSGNAIGGLTIEFVRPDENKSS